MYCRREKLCHAVLLRLGRMSSVASRGRPVGWASGEIRRGLTEAMIGQNTPDQIRCVLPGRDGGLAGTEAGSATICPHSRDQSEDLGSC